MKSSSPSISACIVVMASCLIWIAGITLLLIHIFGLSATAGWMVAGVIGFTSIAAVTAILYEMRHAIDLENYIDPCDFESVSLPSQWNVPSSPARLESMASPAFRIRN
jgi:hypothetical protein